MSDELLDKVRARVLRVLEDEAANPGKGEPPISRIMADVETALVPARREAFRRGAGWLSKGWLPNPENRNTTFLQAAEVAYPLPTRTRKVLREERVPGEGERAPLFRVRDGVLEWSPVHDGEVHGRRWHSFNLGVLPSDWARIRHALDLHDRPYRTEEAPADESDPWGEGGAT